jgi:drug/metabolite transporter (DMT)-like permease
VLFALLSLLLAANQDTAVRIRAVARVTGSTALLMNELAGSAAVVAIVALPWVLGGLHPTREDLTWAILLAFAAGFASISALVLFVQDLARFEAKSGDEGEGQ